MARLQGTVLECEVDLTARDWSEACAEVARLHGFQRRTRLALVGTLALLAVVLVLGLPRLLVLAAAAAAIGIVVYGFAYLRIGPRLRWWRMPEDERRPPWRLSARRVETYRAGRSIGVPWDAVRTVVVTRRLLVLDLGDRHGALCLPRRCASPLAQALLVEWATAEGAAVVRRRGAAPTDADLPG